MLLTPYITKPPCRQEKYKNHPKHLAAEGIYLKRLVNAVERDVKHLVNAGGWGVKFSKCRAKGCKTFSKCRGKGCKI